MILPIPAKQYIPELYHDDDRIDRLADKMDSHMEAWLKDTQRLEWLRSPERCPSRFLDELGYMVNVTFVRGDSDREKRRKIVTAIQGHKARGTWSFDVKPKVDAIAEGDSYIIVFEEQAEFILVGGIEFNEDYYWSALGADGEDDELGIDLYGTGQEGGEAGQVFIDVDNPDLTVTEVERIARNLLGSVPEYFMTELGEMSTGAFVPYYVMNGTESFSPEAYYPLDGDADDESGNGYDGVETDISYADGIVGQAAEFDGASSEIDVGALPIDWTNDDWTLSAWARLDGTADEYRGIIGNRFGDGADNWVTLGNHENGTIQVEFTSDSLDSGFDASDGKFHYYVVVKRGTTFSMYIDFEEKASKEVTDDIGGSDNEVRIGRWHDSDQIWDGLIDDVRIHTFALTEEQIRYRYYQAEIDRRISS